MKKTTIALILLLFTSLCFSQKNLLWKGYFSFNDIKDISQSPDKLYAASENAIFSKNLVTNVIQSRNTIDGLSGQTINTIYYSPENKKTLIGYENGLIIVINEIDGKMLNVVDIINKSIPANTKKVNHFTEYENIVYVSCDFGIVQFNLKTLQFGDTYFIGDGGALIPISQTAVFQGNIYAATVNNGIRRASITNPNLNDYNQWSTINGGGWVGITAFNASLYASTNYGALQELKGNAFVPFTALAEVAVDFRSTENYLIITTANHVYLFNTSLVKIVDIKKEDIIEITSGFTCATVIDKTIFLGTLENGLWSKNISDSVFEDNTPNGTLRNNVFGINAVTNDLWAVYGGYDIDYNPYPFYGYSPAEFGISKFNNQGWLTIPYDDISEAKALTRILINPSKTSQVYISSYYSGLLKLDNDAFSNLYNSENTGNNGLQSIVGQNPKDVRVNGSAFDKSGNIWVTNSLVSKVLKVLRTNGQWQSYDLSSVAQNLGLFNLGPMTIDKNETKWLTTQNDGIIGFNDTFNNKIINIRSGVDNGNLPINDARVVAIDHRNQMWIGTRKGLRILNNVDSFLTENQLITEPIIIIEDNLPQELLYEQFISDIVVDGNNNKWIGTTDSGVFLVSPNGQETLYHFTTDNSPMPSNTVNDIDINGLTGEVFIATSKGLISFKGTATEANENLDNVYVYPNPVRPGFSGTVKIRGLLDRANIQITDIQGNLVYETTSEGGTIEWDTMAFGKYKVASGVYMIFISSDDGAKTKTKKVMIIR